MPIRVGGIPNDNVNGGIRSYDILVDRIHPLVGVDMPVDHKVDIVPGIEGGISMRWMD